MNWLFRHLRRLYRSTLAFGYSLFHPVREHDQLHGAGANEFPRLALISNDRIRQYARQVLAISEKSNNFIDLAPDVYQRQLGDPLLLAYYLPQFHPTPENDIWWGRGATDWNNVSRAVPQYLGHYQPRLPGELGYYDLRVVENIKRQVELARDHGVYGFTFYHYWFDGRRLLERPLDLFLNKPEIDFPFCICWANESWTRRFDGNSGEILIRQNDTVESYDVFIESVIPYMRDKRYICVGGRPLLVVYRPSLVPNPQNVFRSWRSRLREAGLENPYILGVKENGFEGDLLGLGFDAQSEFHPGTVFMHCRNITREILFLREDFTGSVFDYEDIVRNKRYLNFKAPKLHRAVMPMWDNTPRRNNAPMVFHGSTPRLYKSWLKDVLVETRANKSLDAPIVFINAWNEWGESAYLEPDRRFGYAYLRATREALEETRPPKAKIN